ncbi:Cytochrome P450 71B34 [Bienertia sinuspersici]
MINEANQRKQPPGSPRLPIFGNLFSLDIMPHISLMELANKYGPYLMLQLGQVPIVIVSSAEEKKPFKNMMFLSLAAMLLMLLMLSTTMKPQ